MSFDFSFKAIYVGLETSIIGFLSSFNLNLLKDYLTLEFNYNFLFLN